MPNSTISVTCKVVGGRPDPLNIAPISLSFLDQQITVAELIRRTVTEQIRELLARYRLDYAAAQCALDRHYLTPQEITLQARQGEITVARKPAAIPPEIDVEAAVRKALHAFESQAYFILIEGAQMERLDQELRFTPGASVVFLRLMPLVGG